MEETLQHQKTAQCVGLPPASLGNHHPDGNQAGHALTFKMDHSVIIFNIFLDSIPMRKLSATLCLTLAVLLGSAGMSASADFQKGSAVYKSGDYATALRE